jgi:homoprotocatechuate degradation regulator HpaR
MRAMTKIRRFSDSLPMLLLRARETAMARFRPILHEQGLTEQQWRVMRALEELGPTTAAGVAAECSILAPSMTRILRKLAELKLISTSRSKNDQREMVVRMTPKGKRLVDMIGPRVEVEYAWIRDQLQPENLASLTVELKRLIELGRGAAVTTRASLGPAAEHEKVEAAQPRDRGDS